MRRTAGQRARPNLLSPFPASSFLASLISLALAAATLLSATGCDPLVPSSAVSGPDAVLIPAIEMPGSRMPSGQIPAAFKVPPGRGRFPAVIVLHGCSGIGSSQLIWAHRLNGWGYAALIPDSMTPRGVTRVCEPDAQKLVTPWDRVGDVGSAVAWLRARRDIDPRRIAVLGLSHGGTTAVIATGKDYAALGLRAAIDYDGPCVDPAAHGDVPLLVLAGGEDDWGHPARRCEAFGAALQPGQVFEIHVYPGVYHAFDNPEMTRLVSNSHIMEYNKEAADDSNRRVHAFLERWVGP